jgi:hypothetical protein
MSHMDHMLRRGRTLLQTEEELIDRVENVITEALAAEREACAKIADKKADEHAAAAKASGKGMGPLYRCKAEAARWIAQAIRTSEGTPQ